MQKLLRKINFLILFFCISKLTSNGQIFHSCNFDLEKSALVNKNLTLKAQLFFDETKLKLMAITRTNSTLITIPIIVHILYNSPSENVHDSAVFKLIKTLNQDFGRTNPDTVNTPIPFQTAASSTGVQFCLAQQDSLGNTINGIEHIFTNASPFNNPLEMEDASNGGVSGWNRDNYFNIWIGNASFVGVPFYNVLMYPAYKDQYGLLIDYRYLNQIDSNSYYTGRQVTHAMGHCLNLGHLYLNSVACNDPDSVSDTPSGIATSICPTFPEYTCNTTFPGDMFMNFMYDIWYEDCQNMFTVGQGSRIINSLNLYYPQLFNSIACNVPNSVASALPEELIQVYPNPVQKELSIRIKKIYKLNSKFTVDILDQIGKQIFQFEFSSNVTNTSINLPKIDNGFYILKIYFNGKTVYTKKLIVVGQ